MRQLNFQQTSAIQYQSQAAGMLPGHGTGAKIPASNDAAYVQEESVSKMVLAVLGNVVGGAIFLAAMFNLPIILAVIWGL